MRENFAKPGNALKRAKGKFWCFDIVLRESHARNIKKTAAVFLYKGTTELGFMLKKCNNAFDFAYNFDSVTILDAVYLLCSFISFST